MSSITRERLLTIQQWRETYGPGSNVVLPAEEAEELARIALASLEAEPVAYIRDGFRADGVHFCGGIITAEEHERTKPALSDRYNWKHQPLYTAPPAPVSVPEFAPIAYIFKHPAGRLFWALTDEINKGQSDVMPVYSAPVPAFVPPAIEPDYEVIKGILPTANPDEYACCIAADMWNACRAAMLQGGKS